LDSGELLFQVMSDGLLLLPSEDGNTLAHTSLIQGLACGSHGNDESILLSPHGSRGGLSCGHGILLLPLSGGGGLLLINREVGGAAQHGWQDSEGGGQRRTLRLGQR
jgi:hypothetical protein